MKFKRITGAIFVAGAIGVATGSYANAPYPDRPITLVVPYATGGFASTLGHIVANELEKHLKQPIVIENKPGANGNLASRQVVNAKPDGYTLILTTSAILCINPALYSNTPFDSAKDFSPVSQVITTALVGVVRPDSNFNSIMDVIKYAKENPGAMTFGSSGIGSLMHLSGELLNLQTGVDMMHVPYKGGGPAVVDLMGGRIDLMFSDTNVLPHVQAGKLKALAVTGNDRISVLPNTPTVAQAGVQGFSAEAWYAIMAPAGTPAQTVQTLSEAMKKVLADPSLQKQLISYGVSPVKDTSPQQVKDALLRDLDKWQKVVQEAKIKVEQ